MNWSAAAGIVFRCAFERGWWLYHGWIAQWGSALDGGEAKALGLEV